MNVCRMAAVVLVALALLVGLHAEAARHQYERQQLPGSRIMKSWPVEITDSGGVLLLSDSPEYVQEYGILYSDVVRGDARIFYYHVNVTPRPGKLAVILENQGTKSTSVAVLRGGMAEPGANYFAVGKTLSQSYMEAARLAGKVFLPGWRNYCSRKTSWQGCMI